MIVRELEKPSEDPDWNDIPTFLTTATSWMLWETVGRIQQRCPGLPMVLVSVNLMLYHLPYMPVLDTSCSVQPDNGPESPYLNLLPLSSSSLLRRSPYSGGALLSTNHPIQSLYPQQLLLLDSHTLEPYILALTTSGLGARLLDSPSTPQPAKIIQTSQSEICMLYLALSFPWWPQ